MLTSMILSLRFLLSVPTNNTKTEPAHARTFDVLHDIFRPDHLNEAVPDVRQRPGGPR